MRKWKLQNCGENFLKNWNETDWAKCCYFSRKIITKSRYQKYTCIKELEYVLKTLVVNIEYSEWKTTIRVWMFVVRVWSVQNWLRHITCCEIYVKIFAQNFTVEYYLNNNIVEILFKKQHCVTLKNYCVWKLAFNCFNCASAFEKKQAKSTVKCEILEFDNLIQDYTSIWNVHRFKLICNNKILNSK